MKKYKWLLITGALAAIVWAIYYYSQQSAAEPFTDENGVTWFDDGSYSYEATSNTGTVSQYTMNPDGTMSISTISQGTGPTLNGGAIPHFDGTPIQLSL